MRRPEHPRDSLTRPIRLVHVLTVPMTLRFMRGQVPFMKSRGFDLTMVTSPGEELNAFGESEDVSTVGIEMPRRITVQEDLHALRQLVALLRRLRPDIVHSHTPKGGLLGMIAAWIVRVPVRIYHMRGLPFLAATGWRRRLLHTTERVACRLAHRVISVSQSNRAVAIAEGLCSPEKIIVLGGGSSNGVDAVVRFSPDQLPSDTRARTRASLGLPDDSLVVGFVGRIVRDKGIVELLQAWQRLAPRFPKAHLLLVGPIEPFDPLPEDTRRALDATERVHLAGERLDLPALYAAMDVLALPTYREGFPNVVLEAASMEVPVVATRVPGCIDAVEDEQTGLLVPAYDAPALATALERYLSDASLRRTHGAAGRKRVLADFRSERIWGDLFDEYHRLLNAQGAPVP